ncbi:MAG: GIN domain-containing protein [bacterium]
MKKLIYLMTLCAIGLQAQVKGNGTIETKTFSFENVETIKVNLYAKITIDQSQDAALEITTDSNLFKYIDREIVDGQVDFNQLNWIQPSQDIIIKIGAPMLKRLVQDTHDTTIIKNINSTSFNVNANIGKVILDGVSQELRLGAESGIIEAENLKADEVFINLWGSGTIKVNPINYLWAELSEEGKLYYTNLPERNKIKTSSGALATNLSNYGKNQNKDLKWISFKIKNNSSNRNHFVVKGPKEDGSSFGYGFPMMPYSKRKEKWSVGTKIYKQTKLGFKKLLVTITAENEGQTVLLFND